MSFCVTLCAGKAAPITPKTPAVDVSCLRQKYFCQGLSESVIDVHVIMNSWRHKTKHQNQTYINKWILYCSDNDIQFDKPRVSDVINFLEMSFSEGLSCSVLSTARSAISAMAIFKTVRSQRGIIQDFIDGGGDGEVGGVLLKCIQLYPAM